MNVPSSPKVSRQWHGLSIADDRLWIGPQRRWVKRACARVDTDGPTLFTRRGEMALRWEDGFPNGAITPQHWTVEGLPGSRASVPSVDFLTDMDRWGVGTRTRITGGWPAGLAGIPSEQVAALLQYLADTPVARSGLASADRLSALLDALARDHSWIVGAHAPHGDPLRGGDRLDLHVAADRVVNRIWQRRFWGRPVRGETVPVATDLVAPTRRELSRRVSENVTDAQIEDCLRRLLDVDPWPFDVLIVSGEVAQA